jgi:hypothetical protein
MPAVIKGLKNTQKVRVIINEIGFNTTVKEALNMLVFTPHRIAVGICLQQLANNKLQGIGQNYGPNSIQINLI